MNLEFMKEWRPDSFKLVVVEEGATNIEHQEITVQNGGVLKFGGEEKSHEAGDDVSLVEDDVTECDTTEKALLSVFMGDRQEMEKYLKAINGATDVQVANITKEFIDRRKISEVSKNKTLYDILKARGLYSRSYDNWRKMIM